MSESVFYFGANRDQFGILAQPESHDQTNDAPLAIILNAGIVHHVGPFRLHVNLSRQLAELGYSTLRMDLSGLGESAPRTGQLEANTNRAILDVGEAMDRWTQRTGRNEFVIIGLCSGAYNAHVVALNDKRVVGAVFLDGIVYRTPGFYVRNSFQRFTKPRFWRNAFKRRWSAAMSNASISQPAIDESEFFTNEFSRSEVSAHLQQMLDRNMKMLFIYTDGYDDICGKNQFREMFGLKPDDQNIQVEYYDKSEHTFRVINNRDIACDRITSWYSQQFTSPSFDSTRV